MRRMLRGALTVGREALRLILKRPMFGVMILPVDGAGRVVLMRRRDTGTWGLPGGMAEWGERVLETLARELREETGYRLIQPGRLVGVYSDPRRDPRMHSICVLVEAEVAEGPRDEVALNPMETIEVGAFAPEALPAELAYDTERLIADWRRGGPPVIA